MPTMNDNKFRQEKQQAEALAKEILQFAEKALRECFKSFYESTRISGEVKATDTKLKSLIEIRDSFAHNPNRPDQAYENISKTIRDLQDDMKRKIQEQSEHESRLVNFSKELISKIVNLTEKRCGSFVTLYIDSVKEFQTNMNQEMEKQLSKVLEDIQSLKQSKLEKTDIKQLKDEFEASKAKMVDFSRRTIQAVTAQIDQSTQRQRSLIEKLKEEFDIGRITATVETTVIEKLTATLDDKQKETLKEVKKENEEVLKSIPARIAETVRKEVYEQVGPVNLQKIIEGLSEYKALKSLSEKMITITEQQMQMQQQQQNKNDNSRTASPAETAAASATLMASQEAIKQSIQHISSELAQLKQKNQSTRAIVETLRIQGVPNTNAALHQFDQVAAVKHIEEMQREIEFMHNNVKMIEPVIKMRAQAIEEKMNAMASIRNTDADNGDSRKRPRTEDVTDGNAMVETTATATSNVAVLEKILEIDAKHQKLLDFLSQYKETVLNDTFPARLEAAMKKIEQVLRNHETFISYLIDPFTTAKKVQALSLPSSLGANESSASNVASDTLGSLNPAMLDAITQLVKQTAEEISLPLQKKIKLLEEKLEAKQQNSNSN